MVVVLSVVAVAIDNDKLITHGQIHQYNLDHFNKGVKKLGIP